jgi:hypothetical protein
MPLVRSRACDVCFMLLFSPSCTPSYIGGGTILSQRPAAALRSVYRPFRSSFTWAGRLEREGLSEHANYRVRQIRGQTKKRSIGDVSMRHSSKICISKKRIFYFWRTHPQRNRRNCRKLKELPRIRVWPRDCFLHTRDRTKCTSPVVSPPVRKFQHPRMVWFTGRGEGSRTYGSPFWRP